MIIFRKEHFGGIYYNSETLKFHFDKEGAKDFDIQVKNQLSNRTDIISAPVRVYFELTKKCNLACKHCFVSSHPKLKHDLTTEPILKILDDLQRNGVIDVRFTGGELTTRDDWFEILSYAKRLGFVVSVNTNGVYDNPEEITDKLKILDLNQVTISIDGLRENHDFMRGKGTFDKSMTAIKLMSEKGIKLRFNTVITKRNNGDIPAIIDIASKYVKEINFFYMRPIGRAIYHHEKMSLDFEEHFESAMTAINLREKYPNLHIMHFEQAYNEQSIKDKSDLDKIRSGVPYGNTTLNLASDGSVWPHGYTIYQDTRFKLGNLLEDDLKDIWQGSKKLDGLRQWYRDLISVCKNCKEYKKRCAGLNFEMEVAKMRENISKNNFCLVNAQFPGLFKNNYVSDKDGIAPLKLKVLNHQSTHVSP